MKEDDVKAYVAAAAGYYVVWPAHEEVDEVHQLSMTPIVAWAVYEHWADPICAESKPNSYLILNPDGSVMWPEGAQFKNLEEYLNDVKEKRLTT